MAQKRMPPQSMPNKEKVQKKVKWNHLDSNEQLSAVCELFMEGMKMSEIKEVINKRYEANLNRESTYPLLMKAVRKEWIQYVPPQEDRLERELKKRYDWLSGSRVVHTSQYSDVALNGAETLLDLLKTFRRSNKKEIHIGFAGGHAMRMLANQLSKLLKNLDSPIPQKLVLHALVAGFNVCEPTTDPNTFFTLFRSDPLRGVQYEYVGLHAPPLVESKHYDELMKGPGFSESKSLGQKIDIIITSATCWNDGHSTFRKYMDNIEGCTETLENEGCVGDLLWQPLSQKKIIKPDKASHRSMALFNLHELSNFVKEGKNVLLVLGPCAQCYQAKTNILKAILDQDDQLITHLVADSRSVREVTRT